MARLSATGDHAGASAMPGTLVVCGVVATIAGGPARRDIHSLMDARMPIRRGGVRDRAAKIGFGAGAQTAPKHQASTPFWACSRFSASSNTADCGPSMISSVTSSPRWAGRQCRKMASGAARFMSAALT